MTAGALALTDFDRGAELRRWILAAAIVLATHFGLASVYWLVPRPEAEGSIAAPAVTVELAPVPVSPSQQDLAPGPEMVEPQPTPPEQTEPKVDETPPMVEAPAEVTLPKPEPKAVERKPEDTQKFETEVVQEKTAASRSAQETAATPAAPSPGSAAGRAAIAKWRDLLMARLAQNKRYPASARARGEQGVVMLSFTVDRSGHVLARSIAKGSGFAALDEEVLAMVKRAEPLPAFPPAMVQPEIQETVPIRFRVQ
jgi:periplasmic protein TonB